MAITLIVLSAFRLSTTALKKIVIKKLPVVNTWNPTYDVYGEEIEVGTLQNQEMEDEIRMRSWREEQNHNLYNAERLEFFSLVLFPF